MAPPVLGIVGGSGLYDLPGLADLREVEVATPWGEPSGPLRVGTIGPTPVAFLARHGAGHRLSPSDIDYRANIDALKRAGVTHLVSFTAVGSLREDVEPGTFLLPDQFVDRTFRRASSFFGRGCVAHVSMADPVSPVLTALLVEAAAAEGWDLAAGGTYVCIEGPHFSSRAESLQFRREGHAVVGMTAMPEAKLAREAELPFASVAMVTDYDCWRAGHDAVTADAVVAVMSGNAERARRLVARLALSFPASPAPCAAERALDGAVMTAPGARDPQLLSRLDAVAGRILR